MSVGYPPELLVPISCADVLAAEFPEMLSTPFPKEMLANVNPSYVAKFRQHCQEAKVKEQYAHKARIKEQTKELAKHILPGLLSCSDSILSNPQELAAKAVALGEALAIEFEKLESR